MHICCSFDSHDAEDLYNDCVPVRLVCKHTVGAAGEDGESDGKDDDEHF